MEFMGYKRPDGQVGVRNYIAIIPSVFCANKVAQLIASQVEGCISLPHPLGCSQVGEDLEITARTLIGMGKHPNFAAVLIVGLGCERFKPAEFYAAIKQTGKPVEQIIIQEEGDTIKTVAKGVRLAKAMVEQYGNTPRVPCAVSDLIIALKCGGSDGTSGLSANPATGVMSDLIVEQGGSVILSEYTELLGCEHILAARAVDDEVAAAITDGILRTEEHLRKISSVEKFKHRSALISTGNFDGGISSVVEKSLGGMHKAGSSPVVEAFDYAMPPTKKGLLMMDSPGHDGEVITGMVASGAQIALFTTGRGATTGFPGVPVIKVTGNEETFERMRENMDINAGDIITRGISLQAKGQEMFEFLLAVAAGKKVKAEILGHDELFCITRR